ncbi:hypothetical protein JOD24_002594 [Kroppenstedtia sanguinis]
MKMRSEVALRGGFLFFILFLVDQTFPILTMAKLLINQEMDDGNETILSLFPLPPIVKYPLRGRGEWEGYDLLQRTHSETRERKATLARLVPYGCKGESKPHNPDPISYLK